MGRKKFDDKVVERVLKYIKTRVGANKAVSADTIEKRCGIAHTKGNSFLRRVIIMRGLERGIPIISSDKGYFVAKSYEEIITYLLTLEFRVHGILERKMKVIRAYENYYSQS